MFRKFACIMTNVTLKLWSSPDPWPALADEESAVVLKTIRASLLMSTPRRTNAEDRKIHYIAFQVAARADGRQERSKTGQRPA